MTRLTNKQRMFVEHYLQCWNGTEAARRAQYRGNDNTLAAIASQNLRKLKIRAEIERRISAAAISANEVLWQLGKQAKGSIADFLTVSDGEIGVDPQKVKELGHLIKKLHFSDGKLARIELYDAQAALTLIGKAHGLFKEQHEHSWREQAREDGVDPDVLLEQLIEQFTAAMVGAGGGGGVAGDAPQGGAGTGG